MSSLERVIGRSSHDEHEDGAQWLSVSDLMAGLMMVFLFIAVSLMLVARRDSESMRGIAETYSAAQRSIYEALLDEFRDDLPRWGAEIDPESLSFEFHSPDVLFEAGKTEVGEQFRRMLDDFFPRYVATLRAYQSSIEEIRVEGHTSSDWSGAASESEAYFSNMWLSQGRTREVLRYAYGIPEVEAYREWMRRDFAAVGFSSSKKVLRTDGQEDRQRSRRVTFRVVTNAEVQIRSILATGAE